MLQFDRDEYLKDLEYLANIDSGTGTAEGVSRVADFLAEKYEKLGLTVTRHLFDERYGPCLEARNYPDCEEIDLLLIGHMDTVFPPGSVAEHPFHIEDGKAYGLGAADMKGGDLLAIVLAEHIMKVRPEMKICFANNPDEEIGSPSADRWLRDLGARSKYCFDFEPGKDGDAFVKTRKGVKFLKLKAHGIAAHAGVNPAAGANAIVELARWTVWYEENRARFPGANANFDVIKGGTATNVIAEEAEISIDIRFTDYDSLNELLAFFREREAAPFDSRVKVEVIPGAETPPMVATEKSLAVMKMMEEEGERLGIPVKFVGTGGGSDASRTSIAGAATIDCCGPTGVKTHNVGEYLILDTIEPRLELLSTVMEKLEI